jgi:hypothetical protein
VQALQHHPEYAMTLHARKKNHIGSDHTTGRNANPTAGRTVDRTAGCTAEVVVHDPSVCAGSMRNAESRMDLRTVYPINQEYQ